MGLLDNIKADVNITIDAQSAAIAGVAIFLAMLLAILLGATIVKHSKP